MPGLAKHSSLQSDPDTGQGEESPSRLPLSEIGLAPTPRKAGQAFKSIWNILAPYLTTESMFDSPPLSGTRKQNLTVLFADICGFTTLAELIDPEDCVKILNEYFCMAVESVFEFGGTVDKFQGDGVMATFTGIYRGENHERRGVKCALRLRTAAQHLNISGLPGNRLRLGIGISSGIAAVGNVGSTIRRDYTAIGDVVNVAHRLQSISEPDQIIISDRTCRHIGDDLGFTTLGYVKVKGRTSQVATFEIAG